MELQERTRALAWLSAINENYPVALFLHTIAGAMDEGPDAERELAELALEFLRKRRREAAADTPK